MIYTIGETVIDMIFKNMQPQAAKVGGSALNTSVSLGRLGNSVSFISEIGNDELGAWCTSFLHENGVDTAHLVQYQDKKTSLALAFLNENNDAKYQFYKEFTDPMIVDDFEFSPSDIVLFSSSFALNDRVRHSVVSLLQKASAQNVLIMYDPNMRKTLDVHSQKYTFLTENLRFADIVHLSDEDATAIFGTAEVNSVFCELQKYGVQTLVFTQNKFDVILKTADMCLSYPVPQINPVSTIGAGDTFNAGVLHSLAQAKVTKIDITKVSVDFWNKTIPFAISCAGKVCLSMDNYLEVRDKN